MINAEDKRAKKEKNKESPPSDAQLKLKLDHPPRAHPIQHY